MLQESAQPSSRWGSLPKQRKKLAPGEVEWFVLSPIISDRSQVSTPQKNESPILDH